MTRRDIFWRAAGAALTVGGCVASAVGTEGSPLTLLYFGAAILGIVLMLNGKRVAITWRAERRGHCNTAAAIHAQRVRRRQRAVEGGGGGPLP